MTDPQILAWADLIAPTREMQILVIRDLLRHASSDKMSADDRTTCRKALNLLTTKRVGVSKEYA